MIGDDQVISSDDFTRTADDHTVIADDDVNDDLTSQGPSEPVSLNSSMEETDKTLSILQDRESMNCYVKYIEINVDYFMIKL